MYIVPFFHRGNTEAPQRPQRPQRRKHDAFFQRGHRGAAFFLLMGSSWSIACRRCRGTSGDRAPVWIAIEFRVNWIPTRVSSVRTACMQILQVLQPCHLLLCSRSPAVLIPLKLLSSLQRNLYLRFYPYSNGCS